MVLNHSAHRNGKTNHSLKINKTNQDFITSNDSQLIDNTQAMLTIFYVVRILKRSREMYTLVLYKLFGVSRAHPTCWAYCQKKMRGRSMGNCKRVSLSRTTKCYQNNGLINVI